jgi:hypothetical protein
MFFSWNFPPEVTGLLQDMSNGIFVNEPISGSGIFELTNFVALNQMKLFIYYNNIITLIEDEKFKTSTFNLEQNYPNPFNPSTTIKYSIQKNAYVNLSVYNMLGQKVIELVNEMMSAGEYQIEFNSAELSSGVYIAKLISGDNTQLIKMILAK